MILSILSYKWQLDFNIIFYEQPELLFYLLIFCRYLFFFSRTLALHRRHFFFYHCSPPHNTAHKYSKNCYFQGRPLRRKRVGQRKRVTKQINAGTTTIHKKLQAEHKIGPPYHPPILLRGQQQVIFLIQKAETDTFQSLGYQTMQNAVKESEVNAISNCLSFLLTIHITTPPLGYLSCSLNLLNVTPSAH